MKLASYLQANEIHVEAFAVTIGVSRAAVIRYRDGDRIPRPEIMLRINQVTNGAVRADDFYSAEAAE